MNVVQYHREAGYLLGQFLNVSVQFQPILVILDLPNVIFESNFWKQWRWVPPNDFKDTEAFQAPCLHSLQFRGSS